MAENVEKVQLNIASEQWSGVDVAVLAANVVAAIEALEINQRWPVSILCTADAEMAALNRTYRGKEGPTNVLSFPADETFAGDEHYLGDIAIGFEICEREAVEKSILFEHHVAHLLVHGILHLLGYDHQSDDEARTMENLEIDVLSTMNIANPYSDDNALVAQP